MHEPWTEELSSVLIRLRNSDLPNVYVDFDSGLDKVVWVDVTERGLRLTTQTDTLRLSQPAYEEGRDAPVTDVLAEAVRVANALVDQVGPFVQPVMDFVRSVHLANPPHPHDDGMEPEVRAVAIHGWLGGPIVAIQVANMGDRSGLLAIGDGREAIFDAGLNFHLQAAGYQADIDRIVAPAQSLLESAGVLARSMERYLPRTDQD